MGRYLMEPLPLHVRRLHLHLSGKFSRPHLSDEIFSWCCTFLPLPNHFVLSSVNPQVVPIIRDNGRYCPSKFGILILAQHSFASQATFVPHLATLRLYSCDSCHMSLPDFLGTTTFCDSLYRSRFSHGFVCTYRSLCYMDL